MVRHSSRITLVKLGLALVLLVALPGLSRGFDAPAADKNFSSAMKSFIDAMVRKDQTAVLSFFSQHSPWKYVSYEIGTGKQLSARMVDYRQMAGDFAKKNGWYGFFFHEPNGYTFQVNFQKGVMWKKRGSDTFVAPHSDNGKTYVRWKLEGARPVIAEIGETTP